MKYLFYFIKTNLLQYLFFSFLSFYFKLFKCETVFLYFSKAEIYIFSYEIDILHENDKNLEISFDQLKTNEQINQSE